MCVYVCVCVCLCVCVRVCVCIVGSASIRPALASFPQKDAVSTKRAPTAATAAPTSATCSKLRKTAPTRTGPPGRAAHGHHQLDNNSKNGRNQLRKKQRPWRAAPCRQQRAPVLAGALRKVSGNFREKTEQTLQRCAKKCQVKP